MLDRTKAPEIQTVSQLKLPEPEVSVLDNGIRVYESRLGTQDVIKMELVFLAGRPYEEKEMVARATSALLKEGTEKRNGEQIAEFIDFYGGSLSGPFNLDTSNLVLYSLTRHFDRLLPLVAEILTMPSFPEEELIAFKERNKQRLQIDLSRGDVVAYRAITEMMFGGHHPYGYNSRSEHYDGLTRTDLLQHFRQHFHGGNCMIFISGKTDHRTIPLLNTYLGKGLPKGKQSTPRIPLASGQPEHLMIPHPDTVQTAVRIGRRLFDRNHPDFNGMYVLNTILGGYFGSRLMANIREDKGYTYNIYSTVDPMVYDGYFYIGTEVGNEFAEAAIREIYSEVSRLQQDLVPEEEMTMVRNYLLGNLLTMLDGPFNVSEVTKTMVVEGLPTNAFEDLVRTIREVSSEEIRVLAQRYFQADDLWEIVVGNAGN
jgi:zinc protease